ncbi:MAG: CTP synthase, partial [Patescibacteria group bacterium]
MLPIKKTLKHKGNKNPKYIFVVGGVMSGVGKGIASSSIGKLLQSRGLEVTSLKIDPYVNVDAGTMNPTEHGEVFVLDDGTECDQDMGNYERFLDRNLAGTNYMTTGSVYLSVIQRERNLGYKGNCVSVVPHIPLEVISRIDNAADKSMADIVITEIGGTVGEYENILFMEAVRILKLKKPNDVLVILVSYLPTQGKDTELKTKPTQHAVRALSATGIQPDIIIARAVVSLDRKRKEKIAFNCNIRQEDVISAPNVESIYDVPINFERDHISSIILDKLKLKTNKFNMREWLNFVKKTKKASKTVRIGIVGKYFSTGSFVLGDSYISVTEALKHAGAKLQNKVEISWLDAEDKLLLKKLTRFDGIIVPGGFGKRGVEGKISVIRFCRQQKIPYFGLCYGMQLMVVEYARNICGLKRAQTTEIDETTPHPVIDILPEQKKNIAEKNYGASMRLGIYPTSLKRGTIAYRAYRDHLISERHRHRYEVNPRYIESLEKGGLMFSGFSP